MLLRRWVLRLCVVPILVLQPLTGTAGASPYDVTTYRLSVTLDFDESPGPDSPHRSLFSVLNTLTGEAAITVRNTSDEPLASISLILHRLMKAAEIEVEGQQVPFDQKLTSVEDWDSYQIRHVTVTLAEPLAAGREATLSVRYGGQLQGYAESGMLYVRETLDPDFTILRHETFCYPQVALPRRDAIQSARRNDKFDQELDVTVPSSHIVVNAGKLTGVKEETGVKTYSFSSYEPDSVIMLPIAPYRVLHLGPSKIYHFEESAGGARLLAKKMERVMELFSSWFGAPALDRGLTVAEIPEFFGSQSGALILQTSGAFTNPEQYGEFYHELSHLWNARDVDPNPSRWNEGLAMFLQGVVEEKLGKDGVLDRQLSDIFSGLQNKLEKDEKLAAVAPIDYGKENYTSWSYSTGALFFGLLYDRVGEDALLDFLGTYFREHVESGSTDRDFALELVSSLGETVEVIVQEWFLTPAFSRKVEAMASWQELRESYRLE